MNTTESDDIARVDLNENVLSSYECFLIAFVLGAIAATFAKCISAPFERVKLFQQCLYAQYSETKLLSGVQTKYPKSIIGIIKFIYQTQGFFSFWRGNLANCLRYVPKFALDMALKQELRNWYSNLIQAGVNQWLKFLSKWLSGSTAAAISTIVCYPLDYARTRLATDVERSSKFNGIIDCWRKTIRQNGILAIYSGMSICLIGDVVYRGLKYTFYDFLKPFTDDWTETEVMAFLVNWLLGWIVSGIAGTIAMPLDTIKRVMMNQPEAKVNMVQCGRDLVRENGMTRLWRGTCANLIRSWSSGLALALFSLFENIVYADETIMTCKQ